MHLRVYKFQYVSNEVMMMRLIGIAKELQIPESLTSAPHLSVKIVVLIGIGEKVVKITTCLMAKEKEV